MIAFAYEPYNTSDDTRSGYVAAKSNAIGPPSDEPNSAARSEPAASITARTSSIRSSRVAASVTRSDKPVPRLSNKINRENDASRRKNRANGGHYHATSKFDTGEGENTRSNGPSPTTWYAMYTSPLRAY